MAIKQWFIHFIQWIRSFPSFNENTHLQISIAGHPKWYCPICGATGIDKE